MSEQQLSAFVHSHLLNAIEQRLRCERCVSEYQLTGLLNDLVSKAEIAVHFDAHPSVKLFQKHFLIRHCLYLLILRFDKDRHFMLSIGITEIRLLEKKKNREGGNFPDKDAFDDKALSEYYLDLNNYFKVAPETIAALLADFSQRFRAADDLDPAYQSLGVPVGASKPQVRKAYLKLAALHHPDKGGSATRFREIASAYEILKKSF